jgi:hypothetical protein
VIGVEDYVFAQALEAACSQHVARGESIREVLHLQLRQGMLTHLTGTGIFFTKYSHTASMLYLSWAEMGTTGASAAMVPAMKACQGTDIMHSSQGSAKRERQHTSTERA